MVEEPTARPDDGIRGPKVGREIRPSDVFEHAHRGDGVEGPELREIAIVAHLRPDQVVEPSGFGGSIGFGRLAFGERHADRLEAIVLGCEDDQRAPATANVEEALARFQLEFAADEVELRLLGGVEISRRVVRSLEVGAGIRQAMVEPEAIEVFAYVVVKADRRHVAGRRMAGPGQPRRPDESRRRRRHPVELPRPAGEPARPINAQAAEVDCLGGLQSRQHIALNLHVTTQVRLGE